MIKNVGKEKWNMKMEILMREIGSMEGNMEEEFINIKMEMFMMVNIKTI